ncbi:hypothetical protein LVISKB_1967 [Levilactobacillus brevis KB290]|uniref:Uncharacterized protein n=1 Tax=Levilactobacillus brevis KB290 TaxID=1001583 RepID=M5AGZ4_LEVBR|nr:hypothetical protein LVISKB_1967 [Levilactobacillus brevis KB290]
MDTLADASLGANGIDHGVTWSDVTQKSTMGDGYLGSTVGVLVRLDHGFVVCLGLCATIATG